MIETTSCPNCGFSGSFAKENDRQGAFVLLGRVDDDDVVGCLACGRGFFFDRYNAQNRPVPQDEWDFYSTSFQFEAVRDGFDVIGEGIPQTQPVPFAGSERSWFDKMTKVPAREVPPLPPTVDMAPSQPRPEVPPWDTHDDYVYSGHHHSSSNELPEFFDRSMHVGSLALFAVGSTFFVVFSSVPASRFVAAGVMFLILGRIATTIEVAVLGVVAQTLSFVTRTSFASWLIPVAFLLALANSLFLMSVALGG